MLLLPPVVIIIGLILILGFFRLLHHGSTIVALLPVLLLIIMMRMRVTVWLVHHLWLLLRVLIVRLLGMRLTLVDQGVVLQACVSRLEGGRRAGQERSRKCKRWCRRGRRGRVDVRLKDSRRGWERWLERKGTAGGLRSEVERRLRALYLLRLSE